MANMNEVMTVIRRFAPKDFVPKVGIILGSGLSSIAEQIENPVTIPYATIPGLPTGTVVGHASLLVMGYLNGVPVVCLKGRVHAYEGASYESMQVLVRLVKNLGAESIIITGAAGSMVEDVGAGEVMMITDHINFQPGNALAGPNDETIGPRFFGMEDAYDPALREVMRQVAKRLDIKLAQGVYLSVLGPSFETPAEIRAFKMWGAHAVGMSVVPEVIIARHCGLKVGCLAAITNLASGMSNEKLTHENTLLFGELAARKMAKIILETIRELKHAMV